MLPPPLRPKPRERFSASAFDFDAASDFPVSRPRTAASVSVQPPAHHFSPPHHAVPDDDHGFGSRPRTRHGVPGAHVGQNRLDDDDDDASVLMARERVKVLAARERREDTVEAEGMGAVNVHDDSGIGLGLDDEFGLDGRYGGFVGGVHGSDPADVVVC